ncbi:MAG TPA: hypothetical protein VGH23_11155 [Rhizomicrobium sp.]
MAAAVLMVLPMVGALAQGAGRAPWHDPSRCSRKDVMEADAATDHMKDWAAVYSVFKQYGKCDDGGIAEGNSDAVVKLLALHWQSVDELSKLIQKDPQFGDFVIAHIDETADFDQEKMIVAHARVACPRGMEKLCKRLGKRAENP